MTEQDLRDIPNMQRQIDKSFDRLDYLQSKAMSAPATTSDDVRVQKTVENKSMIMADAAVDLERELDDDIRTLKRLKKQANAFIDHSDLSRCEKELMKLRYVKCMYWSDVADVMQYHPVYVQQMHRRIMLKLFPGSEKK